MLFSQRMKLVKEYEDWINSIPGAKDCALNVITFLYSKDLFKDPMILQEDKSAESNM